LRRALLPAAVVFLIAAPVVSADVSYRVIVHPQVKGNQIPRTALSSIFLKQAPKWADGQAVQPIDQSVQSTVRRRFSNDVLGQGVVAVQVYWQRRMSDGMIPPPVKTSDEEIVSFVASTPGAIGYISSATPLPDSVKAVEITD